MNETTQSEKTQSKEEKGNNKKRNFNIPLIYILILSLIALVGYQYWQTQQLSKQIVQQKNESNRLQTQQTKLSDQVNQKNINWALSEVQYNINLASNRLQFMHDTTTAEGLLKAADHRLKQLNDPQVLELRRAITQDLSDLTISPAFDVAGVLAKLDGIANQLSELPLIPSPAMLNHSNDETQVTTDTKPSEQKQLAKWRQGLHNSWQSLQRLVVIRHWDQPIKPLLAPGQRSIIEFNLYVLLQQAKWAVLQWDDATYQEALTQFSSLLTEYFSPTVPVTQTVQKEISELQALTIPLVAIKLQNSPVALATLQQTLRINTHD